MTPPTVHSLTRIPAYEGPHAIPGIRFRGLRAALGVEAWGMNVLELDPHCGGHPTHDHESDGQEEVYIVLSGDVLLRVDEHEVHLHEGEAVRVPPEATRQLRTEASAAVVLALGGTPGSAYEAAPGM